MSDLVSRDLEAIWHPYTQMKTAAKPIPIVKGEGVYLYTEDGKKLIDAVSSWWVNIHGHSHPYIAEKVFEQLQVLEHVIFAGFTHPQAVKLAENLLSIIPKNQAKIFYSDNGSTAVEVAIKMCLQFWSNQNQHRTKILAFKNSYHGDTFGAMAVSARSAFTAAFDSLLFDVEFLDLPNENNLEVLKSQISNLKSELACFIFEPLVQGAGGMLMYEAEDLDELILHCKKENVLTIADEVMTGFGRTGKLFASDHLTQKADLMCFSKGLTGGTMPLGVTSCTQEIYDAFLSDDKLKTLFHGHSFTANPVACAASNASFDILMQAETHESLKRISKKHHQFKEEIELNPKVKNVRQCGTILAMEWNIEATSYFNNIRDTLYNFFLDKGIILRPLGNILYIMPPYCISNDDLDYIYNQIREALIKF
ncbi:adenosylmethionine--8-amino-7-oxononanoate aminotransferase BioA [Pedobacter psychrophilus]|uniref:Adenosylmethionine-8-amino-7-oxononanoate aminotransferase n=1 Tax=Pedobacter psychrophilus TaxID=1826909 RepID=A0A179DAN5_9SPHI|nr:adenosylmethionine--8-amino-7-oxononanoate transaminase [Pedobacter psychrophilus]OAQ38111.1 adenosylmethionine--8-amino-7-oxononanoate aminotransferase BioA [Pedobacter psychrophilus]